MTTATQRKLKIALDHHRVGRLAEAERLYRQILRQFPRQDDALHLLGLLRHQQGDHAEALRLIDSALKIRPSIAIYYENLASIQRGLSDLPAVVETCRRGLQKTSSARLSSELIEALLRLGHFEAALAELDALDRLSGLTDAHLADRALCLVQLGQIEGGAASAARALELNAVNGNALSVLADVATRRNQHALAIEYWRAALRIRPDWTAARVNLALSLLRLGDAEAALDAFPPVIASADPGLAVVTLNGRAAAHRALGQTGKAEGLLRQALAVAPGAGEGWSNLSETRRRLATAEALTFSDRALASEPLNAAAHNNRALALTELDFMRSAEVGFRRAIALEPTDATFINNMSDPLRWLGELDRAIALYRRSLAVDPDLAAARYSLGVAYLTAGDLQRGWSGYDWRFCGDPTFHNRPFTMPPWNGALLKGPLLVWGEQGLGDEIIYGSMLPDLERTGMKAMVECDARMVSLFARALPALNFVARKDPPDSRLEADDIVAQVAMGSLARWYRARIEDFPPKNAYLKPRQDLLDHWRRRLAELGDGPKIGFAWRSRRIDAASRRDHPPVLDWKPVLIQPEVTFISLQYGDAEPDIRSVESALGVRVRAFPDLDLTDDLEGVLALSAALDMTISSPTTAFCLPAAAGTPVWLLVQENTLWLLGTRSFPWFSNVRTYVHKFALPRSETIDRIGQDLAVWLNNRHRVRD